MELFHRRKLDVLLLQWTLHDNILSAGVEIGNRIAIGAWANVLCSDAVVVGLETVI